MIALLAQNQFQIVAGGISAGIFNALEKNLPITILSDRVSTPIGHNLMLRPELKDTVKSLKDLKGKVVASNGAGLGLDLRDRQDAGARGADAHGRRAQDLAVHADGRSPSRTARSTPRIVIPPFVWQLEEQGIAMPFGDVDELVQPQPMTIAVIMANSDWVKANPELVQQLHDGVAARRARVLPSLSRRANRQEIIDELVNTKTAPSRELLEKYPWPARSPNGKINVASMLDINKWYVKNKMSAKEFPAERLMDSSYIDHAIAEARAVRAPDEGQQAAGLPLTRSRGAGGAHAGATARRGDRDRGPAPRICQRAGRGGGASTTSISRVAPGEFLCIVGPSGCGKSTLLRILAGLDRQTSGTIKVDAEGWAVENAMVFQDSGLFPWMSVENNVRFGLDTRGVPADGGRSAASRRRSSSSA